MTYRGRFAPTPSGQLHFGSLITAVASYLDARANQGSWLLRIDNLDQKRERANSAQGIVTCLTRFNMVPDEAIAYQSNHRSSYEDAYSKLNDLGLVYPCYCNRKTLRQNSPYPGTCRTLTTPSGNRHSMRLKVNDETIVFTDHIQSKYCQPLRQAGDFIVRRSDQVFAYHLATVVDDAQSGITHIVRGADLLNATVMQLYLYQLLKLSVPIYSHLPIALNTAGKKLSKHEAARSIESEDCKRVLIEALLFLGHFPPKSLGSIDSIWKWGIENWQLSRIPKTYQLPFRAVIDKKLS